MTEKTGIRRDPGFFVPFSVLPIAEGQRFPVAVQQDGAFPGEEDLDPQLFQLAQGLCVLRLLPGAGDHRVAGAGLLQELFHKAGIELVDAKIEFGRASDNGHIIISDEISPDTCRLWDEADGNRLDKDRFRLDLSDVVASYRSVLERLNKVVKEES